MSKELYYDKTEIELNVGTCESNVASWFERISNHEIYGLEKMGCRIVRHDNGLISTFHDNNQYYFNRTIGVNGSNIDYAITEPRPREIVLPSFIEHPNEVEECLIRKGWVHSLSSIVLASSVGQKVDVPFVPLSIKEVSEEDTIKGGFKVFSKFFVKEGEDIYKAERRFRHNVKNGPHKVAFDGDAPVAMIGAIVNGDTATVYSGFIDELYRYSMLAEALRRDLQNTLIDRGILYIYMKTRSRAISLYAQRFLTFSNVYNERIYESR